MTKSLLLAACIGLSPLAAGATTAAAGAPSVPAAEPAGATGESLYVYITQEDGKQVRAPLFADSSAWLPLARVESEIVTLQDLAGALAGAHQSFTSDSQAGKKDFEAVLNRLVEVRLLLIEAADMGMFDLPEVKQSAANFTESSLREALQRRALQGVAADPAEARRLFEEAAREWKLGSVLFTHEKDAKALVAAVKAGKDFEAAAREAVAAKKAQGGEPAAFLPREKMLPAILAAARRTPKGRVSDPVAVPAGFAVIQVADTRLRDDPKLRSDADAQALSAARKAALRKFYDALVKKYVTTDKKLLRKLDLEAKQPGLEALKQDGRVVARIAGAAGTKVEAITVGDLANALDQKFYHGAENAAQHKRVNARKEAALDALVSRRLVAAEARRLGLDEVAEHKKAVVDFTNSAVFALFIEKVVAPDVKISDKELQDYYESHKREFAYPGFFKLESIGFQNVKEAQASLEKLKSGTDFKWLRSNAEGQIKEGEADVQFNGSTVAVSSMPAELRKLLAGARPGDYRLYASEKGQFHLVHVLDAVPPSDQPFAEVKDTIRQKLFLEGLNRSIADLAGKLRKAHPVKVYLTRIGS